MNSKKSLILTFALLNAMSISHAMQPTANKLSVITLPSAQVLSQRLRAKGFDHFLEKSNIDQVLGNTKKNPLGVATAVEPSLYDYAQTRPPMMNAAMQMLKPQLIETILQDHPEAIAELKALGLL